MLLYDSGAEWVFFCRFLHSILLFIFNNLELNDILNDFYSVSPFPVSKAELLPISSFSELCLLFGCIFSLLLIFGESTMWKEFFTQCFVDGSICKLVLFFFSSSDGLLARYDAIFLSMFTYSRLLVSANTSKWFLVLILSPSLVDSINFVVSLKNLSEFLSSVNILLVGFHCSLFLPYLPFVVHSKGFALHFHSFPLHLLQSSFIFQVSILDGALYILVHYDLRVSISCNTLGAHNIEF